MSEKERKTRDKRRNTVVVTAAVVVCIMAIIGLIAVGVFGGCKVLGYNIEISKPDTTNNAPQSTLINSPNNCYHILQQVDNENAFWESVENISSNQQMEIVYYTATPYQRSDGTWGRVLTLSYRTR